MNKNIILLLSVNVIIIFLVVINYNSFFADTTKIENNIVMATNKMNQLKDQIAIAEQNKLVSDFDLEQQNILLDAMVNSFVNIKLQPTAINDKGQVYIAQGNADSILLFAISLNNTNLIQRIIDSVNIEQNNAAIVFGIFGEYK